MRVSLLKIEPWSRFFPVPVANSVATGTFTTAGSLCVVPFFNESTLNYYMISLYVVRDASSLAMRVSCLATAESLCVRESY